ncbi:MAG: hypothetical protein KAW41_02180 [Candidatus Diapherotrites archaeon]|nr:hypothetical protein [Candidatus Diapherotrites archaeon]
MGRRKLYAIVILAVLLPGVFCAEAEFGETLEKAVGSAYLLREIGGFIGDAFSMLGDTIQAVDGVININQFHTTALYDSAIVPGASRHNYFSGIETGGKKPEEYTEDAWTTINDAKAHYAEAQAACPWDPAKCVSLVGQLTGELAKGNAKASQAGIAALKEAEASLRELGRLGGDLSEYGGEPFDAYTEFVSEYEKPGGRYSKFKSGLDGYASIKVDGKTVTKCDTSQLPGLDDYLTATVMGRGLVLLPVMMVGGLMDCLEITPSALATQYHKPYNNLIGAGDWNSGIREVLKANKRIREATALMNNEHADAEKKRADSAKRLEEEIEKLEKARAGEVNYAAVEEVLGKIPQKPSDLLAAAKESKAIVDALTAEASSINMMKQDNYLALSTIRKRQAAAEATHGAGLAGHGTEVLGEMARDLERLCDSEAEQARQKSLEDGLFSAAKVEEALKKCQSADGDIGQYVEAIRELRFIKASDNERPELALAEIERLEIMIQKAAADFSVEEEKIELKKARGYAGGDWLLESKAVLLEKAYWTAVHAQESIWAKAKKFFPALADERVEAKRLMAMLEEVGGAGGLAGRMGRMEGYYSGTIGLEALGHLAEASELYRDVGEKALEALSPEQLVVVLTEREAPEARCNQAATVHYRQTVVNPYGFEIEWNGAVLAPHEERVDSFTRVETPMRCGGTEELIGWIYPDRETRVASREIESVGVGMAVVEFDVEGALEVFTPGAGLVPGGIELAVDSPGNHSFEVEFDAVPSMEVAGPACEGDGTKVTCRYVLTLNCRSRQDINIVLPRPMSQGDTVSASNGHAENAGVVGVLITGAGCPGYSTVDISYLDLGEDSEELLRKIKGGLDRLDGGIVKDGLVKRYESLLEKSASEVLSRGGKLLGDVEAALLQQEKEKQERLGRLALEHQKNALEAWLLERGFGLPWLPSDTMGAIVELEKAKADAANALATRYGEMSEKVTGLKNTAKLLAKFGLGSPAVTALEERFPGVEDDYLMFANSEQMLLEMVEEAEREADSLAATVVFPEIPSEPKFVAELERAGDTSVELDDPVFVIGGDYLEEVADGLKNVLAERARGVKKLGGMKGLGALDREGIYPAEVNESYNALAESVREEIASARAAAEVLVEAALEGGDGHYAGLARQSLEAGYVNQAYAYATHALEHEGKGPATGLVTMENSVLFLAPVAVVALVWQLRKKKKMETKVQRAIRLAR